MTMAATPSSPPASPATSRHRDEQQPLLEMDEGCENDQVVLINGSVSPENHAPPGAAAERAPVASPYAPPPQSSPTGASSENANPEEVSQRKLWRWRIKAMTLVLFLDGFVSLVLFYPLIPQIVHAEEGSSRHEYSFALSLLDLAVLGVLRIACGFGGLIVAYCTGHVPEEFPFPTHHPNGDKKTREELEQDGLEEPWYPWIKRQVTRPSFLAELIAIITQVYCVVKCLVRLNLEIGTYHDSQPYHPLFWLAIAAGTILTVLEAQYLEGACKSSGQFGGQRGYGSSRESAASTGGMLSRIASSLSVPLLSAAAAEDAESPAAPEPAPADEPEEVRGVSDIAGDAQYKATWADLLALCQPDLYLLAFAFCFLLLAAFANILIPHYLGRILDNLTAVFPPTNNATSYSGLNGISDHRSDESMFEVPGFMENVKKLVLASILAGIFAGGRGSIFTVVGGRVNVRLRVKLMDTLLTQDIGFFDVTKTGDITSRLSSDTTLVGDQVSLNVNVFLRSLVQAVGVLLFMFVVSWQLSILAFISVPVITLLAKWYGNYIRSLTKLMQKKLADGNSVSESALGSMSTIRCFDAAASELNEFENTMAKYLHLNTQSAQSYFGFAASTAALPELVIAVVGKCCLYTASVAKYIALLLSIRI
jgi:ABC transporter transmembrane region